MIVAIQQPEHAPWVGFFNKMVQCDRYVYLDNVQFKKRYFENRNKILTKDGPKWVTVPVISKGHYEQRIDHTAIGGETGWERKYLGSIEHAYKKHPYWEDIRSIIFPAIEAGHNKLADLNIDIIERARNYLGITTPVLRSSTLGVDEFKGSDIILAICQKVGAKTYISGPDGANYLKLNEFTGSGIGVCYHEFVHPQYLQLGGKDFVSHLSFLDLIANAGRESANLIRDCYKVNF